MPETETFDAWMTRSNGGRGVVWTAKEAIACAYCWAEFSRPEETQSHTTPEGYWLGVTERTRNECREVAKRKLLLAAARGEAIAIPRPFAFGEGELEAFAAAAGLKQRHRIHKIITALWTGLKPYREPYRHPAASLSETPEAR